jgi:sulfate transport system ATP-binding protein
LARALAVEPKVLLLDEPFGALDAKVRKELRRWLRMLHQDLDVTSIFVTHDQEEALEVSDRVVLMNQGQIEQIGSPQQVWDQPASPFVYGFLGDVNLFRGEARDGQMHLGDDRLAVGLSAPIPGNGETHKAWAYVRPHDIELQAHQPGQAGLVARLNRAIVIGPVARLELEPQVSCGLAGETVIEAQISAQSFKAQGFQEGALYHLTPRRAQVFLDPAV